MGCALAVRRGEALRIERIGIGKKRFIPVSSGNRAQYIFASPHAVALKLEFLFYSSGQMRYRRKPALGLSNDTVEKRHFREVIHTIGAGSRLFFQQPRHMVKI